MKYCISLYSTEFLHLSVFICVLSLYCKWFTCGDMGSKESEFPGLREPVWANWACTFVARMWIWRDGFVCVLFNVIPLSAWKYPNAALQTGMWFSMASQLFWTKTQVTSTVLRNEQVHFICWFPILVDTGGNNVVVFYFFKKTKNKTKSINENSSQWV